jgi:propanol-preferring alcohol dehydrogenase
MSTSSRAAVLTAPQGAVEVRSVDIGAPAPGQVLVRLEACGICHSDVFVSGLAKLPRTPLTLGHEGIGRIEAVAEGVGNFRAGDRVGITYLGSTCGECAFCTSGRERFCPRQKNTGYTLDGALAGYALADAKQLIRVPDDADAQSIAPLCCAGWTAYGALREANLPSGASLAIYGYGGLGQLALQYGLARELRVAAVDLSESKLERAAAAGAFFTTPSPDSGRTIQKQLGGVDAAIVFTASIEAMEQAIKSVKRTGTIVLVGLTTRDLTLSVTESILKGLHIVGSFLGTREDLEAVFRLGREKGILPATESFPLDQSPELLQRLERGEIAGRAVVSF